MSNWLFKKIELWLVLLLLVFGLIGTVVFGWIVRDAATNKADTSTLGKIAVEISLIPTNLEILFEKGIAFSDKKIVQKNTQILDRKNNGNYTKVDKDFNDDGMLLVSAYSKEHSVSVVYLYDLLRNKIIWQWVPKPEEIIEATPSLKTAQKNGTLPIEQTNISFRSQHPYLLKDGSIVLTSGEGPLVRINVCGKLVWSVDRQFHHSIEGDGENLFVPLVSDKNKDNVIGGYGFFKDDGYAKVSMDGKIISEESIISILIRNGFEGLAFGQGVRGDRIHLNDAEPILKDDAYVKAGDIMLSSRNLSTIFLYRPSTDKILWLKTGPWLSQHDIDYLGNGRFSVFGNDVDYLAGDLLNRKNSNIYVYDMRSDSITKPYSAVFHNNKFLSPTQGLQRILSNEDAFVEMNEAGELYRISHDKIRWKFVHSISSAEIGALHWSRYFNRNELNLDWVKDTDCSHK